MVNIKKTKIKNWQNKINKPKTSMLPMKKISINFHFQLNYNMSDFDKSIDNFIFLQSLYFHSKNIAKN